MTLLSDPSKPIPESTDGPAPSGTSPRSVERIAAEHEARGLLNLIVLVTRCLQSEGVGEREAQQWAGARADAHERLARLYAEGLPREFHRTPCC